MTHLAGEEGGERDRMERWEHCESRVATTRTTISTRTSRRKHEVSSDTAPPTLDLWTRDRREPEESQSSATSLSSLGLHQMRGYDDLQRLGGPPVQWADDEEQRGANKAREPTSTIAFPLSTEGEPDKPSTSHRFDSFARRDNIRVDGGRFNSLPMHHSRACKATDARLSRHRPLFVPPGSSNEGPDGHRKDSKAESVADSSGCSSPEGKVTRLDGLSLRQRSMRSLQGIASAWVPTAIRSPPDSDSESTKRSKEGEERRPVRLDQRRLDKAVKLAMEAAQTSEQDQKVWRERKRRLSKRQSCLEWRQGETRKPAHPSNRFASLPWRRRPTISGHTPELETQAGTMVCLRPSLDEFEKCSDEDDSETAKSAGFRDDEDSSEETGEEGEEVDGFSLDLYISSLGYLLDALNPRDMDIVGDKHRMEMKRKLEEALWHLEKGGEGMGEGERLIQLRVERELKVLDTACHSGDEQHGLPTRAHQAAQASSDGRVRRQSIAGYLTSSALDLGLSVGAGALAAASRAVASLLPTLTQEVGGTEGELARAWKGGERPVGSDAVALAQTTQEAAPLPTDGQPLLLRSQWELTQTLALSVASTMYKNIAAVAEQRRGEGREKGKPGCNDEADQLLLMTATLARNVKRSPLPSQLRALTSQVLSLAGALDQRFSLRKRSADVALRKTGQALYYVRKNDLHVKALRMVWAVVEVSVAAIEAYRDEEEWKEGEVVRIEAGRSDVGRIEGQD